jgi:ubiquinone/menaquinone biosynthesis C-methylase UbiE
MARSTVVMSQGYVHGSSDEREVARLEKQAAFTARFTFDTLRVEPGQRVLDLATGVGAMGAQLRSRWPECFVVGLDLSASQLAAARRNHPEFPIVRGDGKRLPFPDATFHRVHCSWLLEHVPEPTGVLEEVRRVLTPDGFCQFVEVDNETFRMTPPSDAVSDVLQRLNRAQQRAGGDPYVGRTLNPLFRAAGFRRVELEHVKLVGNAQDPSFFLAFVDEFAEIFEGLDESLGQEAAELIARASQALRALPTTPSAELRYSPVIARAWA